MLRGDDPLATVSRHVGVDAALEGLEQGGFSVVAPAHDQRDAAGNPHAPDGRRGRRFATSNRIGKLKLQFEGRRGVEGDHLFARERPIAIAALARQDGAVGDEGDEFVVAQLASQGLLVFDAVHEIACFVVGKFRPQEPAFHRRREDSAEQLRGFAAPGASPRSGKPRAESGLDPVGRQLDCAALEDFLPPGVDGDASALSRTGGLRDFFPKRVADLAREEVGESDLSNPIPEEFARKLRAFHGNSKPQLRGCGEGVGLNMVDVETGAGKLEGATDVAVGAISATVDSLENFS